MGTNWIIEGTIDPKWPHNTRGNIGEVFPEVLTSIGYHLGVVVAEQAWRAAYDELGILKRGDFDRDDPVIIGLYAGYAYLNLSYLRMMGVRAPGSSAEAIDVAFFGEGDPPPYEPRKGDKSLGSSLKILRSVLRALGEKGLPEVAVDSYRAVEEAEAVKPSLDATDEELFAYLHDFPTGFRRVFGNHMITTALAAIVSGILADAAAAAGQPGLVTHLIGAAGDVHSARYSQDLYEIAKTVRDTPALLRAFDDGVEGLLSRIDSEPAAETFRTQFAGFVAEHGHRGPNDWEFSARTWDSDPELALAAIDAMRKTDRDLSPAARLGDDDEKRQAAIAVVRPHVGRLDRMNFDKAIKAIPFWQQGREATRDRAIRFMLPYKQVFRELVRRAAENGGDPDPVHVGLLHPFDELPGHVADPSAFADAVATRAALFDRYRQVEPPFFLSAQDEVPTLEEMETSETVTAEVVAPGDMLRGDAGASGVARGRARVVLDPADGSMLEPGEVLVAPLTDPAWTPLFLPAAAVVVNVGALMSHAVIVARELGIPCVVAVDRATERIRTGDLVEVDGTAGTITVLGQGDVG